MATVAAFGLRIWGSGLVGRRLLDQHTGQRPPTRISHPTRPDRSPKNEQPYIHLITVGPHGNPSLDGFFGADHAPGDSSAICARTLKAAASPP
jgi:hypothetical protein